MTLDTQMTIALLQELGSSLAAHTRSLDQHFETQDAFLTLRHQELEEAQQALPGSEKALKNLELALAPLVHGDLGSMTIPELRKLCFQAGLSGYSKFKKGELVEFMQGKKISAPPLPVKKLKKDQLVAIVEAVLAARK